MKHIISVNKSEKAKANKHASPSIHFNHITDAGTVYCRKANQVALIESIDCSKCKFLYGLGNGDGVECIWNDDEDREVYSPEAEYNRVNKIRE